MAISEEVVGIIIDENKRKRKKTLNQKRDTFIGEISTPLQTVDAMILIDEVKSMMTRDQSLQGLCIVKKNRLVGVTTRNQLHFRISGAYGYSLYRNETIQEIMDTIFLQVDVDIPIHKVAKLAMMRDPERLYDLITITKEGQYFGIVTVKELLEKTMEIEINFAKHMNPLTELPGNVLIEQQLQNCIKATESYGVLYLDLDNFKPFNDVYGFEKGDQVLTQFANILKEIVSPNDFIGHIGGDDFIVVVPSESCVIYCEQIIEQFDANIKKFYTKTDAENGWIASKNRCGKDELFPLLTISIAVIFNSDFKSTYELTKKVGEVKKQCKQLAFSNYLITEG